MIAVMSDPRLLHEIVDTLLALKDKARVAGSPTARAILVLAADAIHNMALKGESEKSPPTTIAEMMRRLGDSFTES